MFNKVRFFFLFGGVGEICALSVYLLSVYLLDFLLGFRRERDREREREKERERERERSVERESLSR